MNDKQNGELKEILHYLEIHLSSQDELIEDLSNHLAKQDEVLFDKQDRTWYNYVGDRNGNKNMQKMWFRKRIKSI